MDIQMSEVPDLCDENVNENARGEENSDSFMDVKAMSSTESGAAMEKHTDGKIIESSSCDDDTNIDVNDTILLSDVRTDTQSVADKYGTQMFDEVDSTDFNGKAVQAKTNDKNEIGEGNVTSDVMEIEHVEKDTHAVNETGEKTDENLDDEGLEKCENTAEIGTDSITDSASENENTSQTGEDAQSSSSTLEKGEENGIIINETDIVTAADLYGRGKRSRSDRNKSKDDKCLAEEDAENENKDVANIKAEKNYSRSPLSKKASRKRSLQTNLDTEAVQLPLKQGWRRELVIRNIFDKYTNAGTPKQRPADVYYHPPKGRKLRSMKEILEYLKKHNSPFTEENFSLLRQPVSEPPYEVVRHAGKPRSGAYKDEVSFQEDDQVTFDKPQVVIERADEDELEEINEEVKPSTSTQAPVPIPRQAKIKVTPVKKSILTQSPIQRGPGRPTTKILATGPLMYRYKKKNTVKIVETLIKDVPTNMPDLSEHDSNNDDPETQPPPAKKQKATARKSTTPRLIKHYNSSSSFEKMEALCNLFCPGQENIPPTLQCIVCLCLFHPSCVAFRPGENKVFTCLRCLSNQSSKSVSGSPRTISIVTVSPPVQLTSSPVTSTPVLIPVSSIKQEPVECDNQPVDTSTKTDEDKSHRESNPTILGHLRSSILERQYIRPSDMERSVSVVQPSQVTNVSEISVSNSTSSNLPSLSIFSNTLRGTPNPRTKTIYVNPTLLTNVSSSSISVNSRPVVGQQVSAFGNTPLRGSGTSFARLVTPSPQLQYVSPTMPNLRTPLSSLMPPRLTLAPKSPVVTPKTPPAAVQGSKSPISSQLTNGVTSTEPQENSKSGQILTLPGAVAKRLNMQQSLALKINNVQITVPPSSFLFTTDGLKLFLPPKTFPLQMGETAKLSVTVTNDKANASQPEVSLNINTHDTVESSKLGVIKPLSGETSHNTDEDTSSSKTEDSVDKANRKTRQWKTGINPGMCFVKKLYGGFDCMFCIFKYLNMKDLLRVSLVCRTWKQLAMHPSHWRTTRLKNLRILDWEKAFNFMLQRAVQSLNFQGIIHEGDKNRTWHGLIQHIHKLACLQDICFGLVPAAILHMLCEKVPHLKVLRAEMITDVVSDQMWTVPSKLDIGIFSSMKQIQELRLRGVGGLVLPAFSFSGGLAELGTLKNLRSLSLTSLKDVDEQEFGFLADLTGLEELELGHCSSWSSETYFHLGKLIQLKKLRLENGGEIPDVGLGDALLSMRKLERLELIMFMVAESLHTTLGQLEKLSHLVVWPDTSSQSAASVNSSALAVVSRLGKLKKLEWGIIEDKEKQQVCDRNDNEELCMSSRSEWIPFLAAGLPTDGTDIPENAPIQFMSVHQFTEKLAIIHPTTEISVFSTEMLNARKCPAVAEES